MIIPGTETKYEDAPLIVRKHADQEAHRLCVAHIGGKGGKGDRFET